MRLEECRVSGVGAIQCRLAVARHGADRGPQGNRRADEAGLIRVALNPDDEDSQPLVCMMGPFGSEREAERNSAADVANGRITPAEGRRVAAEGRKALKAAEAALKIGQMFAKRGPRT